MTRRRKIWIAVAVLVGLMVIFQLCVSGLVTVERNTQRAVAETLPASGSPEDIVAYIIEEFEKLTPPARLKSWHEASLAWYAEWLESGDAEPDTTSPAAQRVTDEALKLDAETTLALVRAGCMDS